MVLWENNGWEGETWGLAIPLRQDGDDDCDEELGDDELRTLLDEWVAAEEERDEASSSSISVSDGYPYSDGYDLAGLGAMSDANPTSYSEPVLILAGPQIRKLRHELRSCAVRRTFDLSLYKGTLSRGDDELFELDAAAVLPASLLEAPA